MTNVILIKRTTRLVRVTPVWVAMLLCCVTVQARPLPRADASLQLLKRCTYGPRASDLDDVRRRGARAWIERQLQAPWNDDAIEARLKTLDTLGMQPQSLIGSGGKTILSQLTAQKVHRAAYSEQQLYELMVDFWMNHFNVYYEKGATRWYTTGYERDAIRPHALGNFRDMLRATARHPAMLIYLDNWQSTGPDSPSARWARKAGRPEPSLNENYARELLELHTLGVDGGYTQNDVVEVARVFSGWTVDGPSEGGGFSFSDNRHDDGEKTVLGVKIAAGGGVEEGERVLDVLVSHPSTAEHIARKLCRRFVADEPPRSLVYRVAGAFRGSGGDIRTALRELLHSPEFNASASFRAKVKSPLELAVSSVRALGADVRETDGLSSAVAAMGQPLYLCAPPTGYPDTAVAWLSPGGFLKRIEFASDLCDGDVRGVRVRLQRRVQWDWLRSSLLEGEVSEATAQALREALSAQASPQRVMALAIGSPEFQRR
jgi:uncharacterized protein (DUF1800 family)